MMKPAPGNCFPGAGLCVGRLLHPYGMCASDTTLDKSYDNRHEQDDHRDTNYQPTGQTIAHIDSLLRQVEPFHMDQALGYIHLEQRPLDGVQHAGGATDKHPVVR